MDAQKLAGGLMLRPKWARHDLVANAESKKS